MTNETKAAQPQAAIQASAVAWIVFAEHEGAMVPQYPACLEQAEAVRHARLYGQTKTEVVPLYRHLAPTIQVQPLTDADIKRMSDQIDWKKAIWNYTAETEFARMIERHLSGQTGGA